MSNVIVSLIILVILIILCVFACIYWYDDITDSQTGAAIGEDCTLHTDCAGWGAGATDNACCNGKCTQKLVDWAGVGYCPDDCFGREGGSAGTCNSDGTVGTPLGEACTLHTDCTGWGAGATDNACCNGICKQKVAGYCNSAIGEACATAYDCAGYSLGTAPGTYCCSGKCAQKQKDWVGAYYCPSECVGTFAGQPGTCSSGST